MEATRPKTLSDIRLSAYLRAVEQIDGTDHDAALAKYWKLRAARQRREQSVAMQGFLGSHDLGRVMAGGR